MTWTRILCLIVAFCFHLSPARAQDVTLIARDGSLEVSGALLSFDGEFYRIASDYGELTLDGSGVLCEGPGCPNLSDYVAELEFAGPSLLSHGLLPELVAAFARNHDYDISTQTDGDATLLQLTDPASGQEVGRFTLRAMPEAEAFANLVADDADLVLSTRAILPAEAALAEQAGLGRIGSVSQTRVLALDGAVPAVAINNSVLDIGVNDLTGMLTGRIDNWQDVGGIDAPIFLHLNDADPAMEQVLQERLLLPLGLAIRPDIVRHPGADALIGAVARDPFAIGLVRHSQLGSVRALDIVGPCGARMAANPRSLRSDDYPFPAPLFLYRSNRRLPALARDFLRFVSSPAAQIAVLRAGLVDQTLTRTDLDRQGDRLANAIRNAGDEVGLPQLQELLSEMQDRTRLSLTFRFLSGTTELDAQSVSNVASLAQALESGTLAVSELVFAGFADGEGSASQNRRLSRLRADSVRDAVLNAAPLFEPSRTRIIALGLGEVMPLTCDETEWGRQINRRVEIWLR